MEWLDIVPDFAVAEIKTIRIKHSHCACDPDDRRWTLSMKVGEECPRACDVVYQIDLHDIEKPVVAAGQKRQWCMESRTHGRGRQRIVSLVTSIPVQDGKRCMTKSTLREIFEMLEHLIRLGLHGQQLPR